MLEAKTYAFAAISCSRHSRKMSTFFSISLKLKSSPEKKNTQCNRKFRHSLFI